MIRTYHRIFTMPNKDTFSIQEIGKLIKRYLSNSQVSVDPFARNKHWCTYTNDLNTATEAEHHMDALDFLLLLEQQKVLADLVLFDPPYSPTQLKRAYDNAGLKTTTETAWRTAGWSKERDVINRILAVGGIVISLGWDSGGMTQSRGYEFVEGLLCYHGGGRNDTIITVERKIAHQEKLWE